MVLKRMYGDGESTHHTTVFGFLAAIDVVMFTCRGFS